MYDLLIKNPSIIDGSGSKPCKSDLAVQGEIICSLAPTIDIGRCKQMIDATGLVVAPGFIDIHSHSDFTFINDPFADSKIRQGVTTEVVGNCGFTPAPVKEEHFDELMQYLVNTVALSENDKKNWYWPCQRDFLEEVIGGKNIVNVASLVGHGTIRVATIGFSRCFLESEDLKKMGALLETDLSEGLWGLSSGLQYDPGSFANIEELVYLCRLVANYSGIYSTHMKSEGRNLLKSIEEAIEIGRRSGVSVLVSHLKSAYSDNWGKVEKALDLIDEAREKGVDIDFDVYPYTAYGSGLIDLVPPWIREDGATKMVEILSERKNHSQIIDEMNGVNLDWENPVSKGEWETVHIASVGSEKSKVYEGKTLLQVGEMMGRSPSEAVLELLRIEAGAVKTIVFAMCDDDLEKLLIHPRAIYCSDGRAVSSDGPMGKSKIHPRYYGTFPRILGYYVREKKLLSLEEAIKKMTALPARKIGLKRRGQVKEGYFADLVLFDPNKIIDKANFEKPHLYPEGIAYVLVNGKVIVTSDGYNGLVNGKLLFR
ncbi:MAG: N-acyl-D-amino-acid deacylase family protein [Bacillota bacterium]